MKLLSPFLKDLHLHALFLSITLFITFYTVASILRFENFHTGRYDLGNMSQTVWNTAHGRIFEMTDPEGQESVSRLAFHADFILILFAPVYWFWDSPKILLITQAFVVGMGAVFIYLISEEFVKNKNVSLAVSFAYLINPALSWSVLFDFHPVTLSTTFLLGSIYFFFKKNYKFFLLFSFLAALTKEQVWLIISMFGPLIFFFHKKKIFGSLTFLIPLVIFVLLIWMIMPSFSLSHEYFGLSYFNEDEKGPVSLFFQSISHPSDTFAKVTDEERTGYLKALFMPLGYSPLIFPFWLLFSIADLYLNLLSDKEELHYIYYHYTATITPFLFASTIFAIYYLKKYIKPATFIAVYIISFAILGQYTYGPLPGTLDPSVDMLDSFINPLPHSRDIKEKLSEIPIDKSLAVPNDLGGYMSNRQDIYLTGTDVTNADYVAFLIRKGEKDEYSLELIDFLKKEEEFQLWYDKYGLIIFKKASPDKSGI